jgi:hypothetical protein
VQVGDYSDLNPLLFSKSSVKSLFLQELASLHQSPYFFFSSGFFSSGFFTSGLGFSFFFPKVINFAS